MPPYYHVAWQLVIAFRMRLGLRLSFQGRQMCPDTINLLTPSESDQQLVLVMCHIMYTCLWLGFHQAFLQFPPRIQAGCAVQATPGGNCQFADKEFRVCLPCSPELLPCWFVSHTVCQYRCRDSLYT